MGMSVGIVGGGVMGLSTACFLAREHGIRATVVERDPGYGQASSARSASSIRVQFSQPLNIRLSQESFAMLMHLGECLGLPDLPPGGQGVDLVERGYLYLATTAGASVLQAQQRTQQLAGAEVALLSAQALQARLPALNVSDLALASLGLRGEGWFDGWALLQALRRSAREAGVRLVTAEVTDLAATPDGSRVTGWRTTGGQAMSADCVVVASGAWSAPLLASIGLDLPVRARKRDVFVFDAAPVLCDGPLLIDPSGLWLRPEGRPINGGRTQRYLCGGPPRGEDLDDLPLDAVDHGLFEEVLWPAIAHRVPALEALKPGRAWAGYYELNTFDHNALVGPWPGVQGLFTVCGFSGHGIQQSLAIGRHLAHRLAKGRWRDAELVALEPARWLRHEPWLEANVI